MELVNDDYNYETMLKTLGKKITRKILHQLLSVLIIKFYNKSVV
jgi:hypothetical protein